MNKNNQFAYDIYINIKNTIGFHRAKYFMDWFHNKYPAYDPHHPFGSYGPKKTSDYTCIPVTRIEHTHADNYEYAIDHLSVIFRVMIEYIQYLENKVYDNE